MVQFPVGLKMVFSLPLNVTLTLEQRKLEVNPLLLENSPKSEAKTP